MHFCFCGWQQSMENSVREYQNQVDTVMTRTLQLAQEEIKTYIGEQRRVSILLSTVQIEIEI